MTLKDIEFFINVAELKNFGKVAKLQFVSDSTVSRHISNMEQEMDVLLFERTNTGVKLTMAGRHYYHTAKRILMLQHESRCYIKNLAHPFADITEGEFVITYAVFGGAFEHLADILDRFVALWLKRPVKLRCASPTAIVRWLRLGYANVGVLSGAFSLNNLEGLNKRVLYHSRYRLLVSPTHPYAQKSSVSIDELIKEYGFGKYYLPRDYQVIFPSEEDPLGMIINNKTDLCRMGELCHSVLPKLSYSPGVHDPLGFDPYMFILPEEINRPELEHMIPVEINDATLEVDCYIYWREADKNVENFLAALDFFDM